MARFRSGAKKSAGRVVVPGSLKAAPKGARRGPPISPDERVTVTVRVRRHPGAGTPRSTGAPLSREQFRATYGADPTDIQAVEEFASEHSLDVLQTSVSQRLVRLAGPAAAIQAAFGVRLARYRIAKSRDTFRGRTGTIGIPSALAKIVTGVFGLDDRPQAKPHFRIRPARRFRPQTDAAHPMTPLDVARLYGFPEGRDGRGQCIAILELGGGFRTDDLAAYFKTSNFRGRA